MKMAVPKELYNSSSDSDEPLEYKVPTTKAPKTPAKKGTKRAAGAKARKEQPAKKAKKCWTLVDKKPSGSDEESEVEIVNCKLALARDSLERELPHVKKAKMADRKPSVSQVKKAKMADKKPSVSKEVSELEVQRKKPPVKKAKVSLAVEGKKPSGFKELKKPQVKKAKVSGGADEKPSGSKELKEPQLQVNAGKKTVIVLENQRQVQIKQFRGLKTVDIREHYERNGKVLPGKKGITLSANQWKQLMEKADEITRAVEE